MKSAYEIAGLGDSVCHVSEPSPMGLTYIFNPLVFCPAMVPGWLLAAGQYIYLRDDPRPMLGPVAAFRFAQHQDNQEFGRCLSHAQTYAFLEKWNDLYGEDVVENLFPQKHEWPMEVETGTRPRANGLLEDVPWTYVQYRR